MSAHVAAVVSAFCLLMRVMAEATFLRSSVSCRLFQAPAEDSWLPMVPLSSSETSWTSWGQTLLPARIRVTSGRMVKEREDKYIRRGYLGDSYRLVCNGSSASATIEHGGMHCLYAQSILTTFIIRDGSSRSSRLSSSGCVDARDLDIP